MLELRAAVQIYLLSVLSSQFLVCPLLLLVSSVAGLGSSVLGVSQLGRRSRRLVPLQGLSSLLALGLTVSAGVSTALLLGAGTADLDLVAKNGSLVLKEGEVWEVVQATYQCCGLTGQAGHEQWVGVLEDSERYPDSCCTLKYPGCGRHAWQTLQSDFANTFSERIFSTGCITVIRYTSHHASKAIKPLTLTGKSWRRQSLLCLSVSAF